MTECPKTSHHCQIVDGIMPLKLPSQTVQQAWGLSKTPSLLGACWNPYFSRCIEQSNPEKEGPWVQRRETQHKRNSLSGKRVLRMTAEPRAKEQPIQTAVESGMLWEGGRWGKEGNRLLICSSTTAEGKPTERIWQSRWTSWENI